MNLNHISSRQALGTGRLNGTGLLAVFSISHTLLHSLYHIPILFFLSSSNQEQIKNYNKKQNPLVLARSEMLFFPS